jgi:ferritin
MGFKTPLIRAIDSVIVSVLSQLQIEEIHAQKIIDYAGKQNLSFSTETIKQPAQA